MTELCNELPNDILLHIKSFIFCSCCKCCSEYLGDDVSLNIYLKKYTSVFEDDFYIVTPDSIYYKILCNKCHFDFLKKDYYPVGRENYKKTKNLVT